MSGCAAADSAVPDVMLKPLTEARGKIVHVSFTGEFCFQLNRNRHHLSQILGILARGVTTPHLAPPMRKVWSLCCVRFYRNGHWAYYRAVVLNEYTGGATVFFIDYGNVEDIDDDRIRQLPASLNSIPAQAVRCRLAGIVHSVTAANYTDRLEELKYQPLKLVVRAQIKDDVHLVDLVFPDGSTVRERFIRDRLVLANPEDKLLQWCPKCNWFAWRPWDPNPVSVRRAHTPFCFPFPSHIFPLSQNAT